MPALLDAIAAYQKRQKKIDPCHKVCYYSPAAAKKALHRHGYRSGCKQWYRCDQHGDEDIYHLTSSKRFTRKL